MGKERFIIKEKELPSNGRITARLEHVTVHTSWVT